ncbi:MAG: hypothetical protein MZV70_18945 [Desulfobacterales bacterium]|nr:hypothetical protein [Desulfobacterales bacterium]
MQGRKLCGLLSEMESEGEQVSFINIGIGLNVNNDPPKVQPPAVSLKALLGREVSAPGTSCPVPGCAGGSGIAAEPWDRVIAEWKTCSVTLNRPVRIVTAKEEIRRRRRGCGRKRRAAAAAGRRDDRRTIVVRRLFFAGMNSAGAMGAARAFQ